MFKLAHLSDLHFGTVHNDLANVVMQEMNDLRPDLAVISGDFTQTASLDEFTKARKFINDLPCPALCVPGNHDIPARNLWARFTNPFARYNRFISADLAPVLETEDLLIIGINTARRALPHWNWANGAVSSAQRRFISDQMALAAGRQTVVVFHHPLHEAEGVPLDTVVFGGRKAMNAILDLNISLVLTGHVHHASVTRIRNTTFVSAATALSSRIRYQENGYNIITFNDNTIDITHHQYQGATGAQNYIHDRKLHTM